MSSSVPQSSPSNKEYKEPWDHNDPPTSIFPYLLTNLLEGTYQKRYDDALIEHIGSSPSQQSADGESTSGNEREPQDRNPPQDNERGPQEPSPSAGNETRSPARSPPSGTQSAGPVQEGDIVINMEDTVHSVLGLTDIYDELSRLEITSREWQLLRDMPQMYLQNALGSMNELGKTMKTLLQHVMEVPVPSNAAPTYQGGMKVTQNRIDIVAKETLRNMILDMHKAWKALEKDQDGVPNDMALYSEKMRALMTAANLEILKAVENFVYKEFKIVEDSDYKRGVKWWFKLGLKVIGVLIGIALALSTDGLKKLLKLEPLPAQVNLNITVNTGGTASAGAYQATEGQVPAPVHLNLNLESLSLGQNKNPVYIEVPLSVPSNMKNTASPDEKKTTARDTEEL